MKDAIIITQCYKFPQNDFRPMMELARPVHQAYADKWGMDYLTVVGSVVPEWILEMGGWAKLELCRQMLVKGYQYVFWVDADALIVDINTDLRAGCPDGIGLVEHHGFRVPGPHLNVGVMLIRNSERVIKFFEEWITRYPGTDKFPWREQGEAHKMRQDPEWEGIVHEIHAKWNSCMDGGSHVEDAVIEAWHGMGSGVQRYAQMLARINEQKMGSG